MPKQPAQAPKTQKVTSKAKKAIKKQTPAKQSKKSTSKASSVPQP